MELSWIESKLNSNYSSLKRGERRNTNFGGVMTKPNDTFQLKPNEKKKRSRWWWWWRCRRRRRRTKQTWILESLNLCTYVLSHGFQKTIKITICRFGTKVMILRHQKSPAYQDAAKGARLIEWNKLWLAMVENCSNKLPHHRTLGTIEWSFWRERKLFSQI